MATSLNVYSSDEAQDSVDLGLDFDEYIECPSPMQSSYCRLMTEEEFTKSGATETERALRELIGHLESNPDDYVKLMRKRKMEELEERGLLSFIKAKVKHRWLGDKRYEESLVSERECRERLEELTDGMLVVHHYAQEAKRCSQRLSDKQSRSTNVADVSDRARLASYSSNTENSVRRSRLRAGGRTNKNSAGSSVDANEHSFHVDMASLKRPTLRSVTNIMPGSSLAPSVPLPPPPPPPPPSAINVLPRGALLANKKSSCSFKSSTPLPGKNKIRSTVKKSGSITSLADLQTELQCADPLKRLKTTNIARSPGGTPALNPSKGPPIGPNGSMDWTSPLNSSEPLGVAFMRILQKKFRDVRSPSPSPNSPSTSINSPGAFSP